MSIYFNLSATFRRSVVIFLALVASFPIAAKTGLAEAELKVLAVGNSFSGNANHYRENLNNADPAHKLTVVEAGIGGSSLEKHLKLALLHEQNPANPDGMPYNYNKQKVSLKDMLTIQPWNVVTIQQLSTYSDNITSYRPYAQDLCDYIKKYCPNAEIVVHETWADRVDNPRLKNKTALEMYNNLSDSYRTIAAELGNLRIIPVGDAFQNLRLVWKFNPTSNFDPANVSYPDLPDQKHTICIGWTWRKNPKTSEQKLVHDHHANAAGCLLAALVWRETLLGVDSRENKFCPPEVTSEDAVVIRAIAHQTVASEISHLSSGKTSRTEKKD